MSQDSIFESIVAGEPEQVRSWFAQHPESFNSFSNDGFTPIQIAVVSGQIELVEYFLDRMVLVNRVAKTPLRPTTLHLAVIHSEVSKARMMIQSLVAHGAELGAQDAIGATPLHLAAQRASVQLVKELIDLGADPFMKDHQGLTVGAWIDRLTETDASEELKLQMREQLKGAFSLPLE